MLSASWLIASSRAVRIGSSDEEIRANWDGVIMFLHPTDGASAIGEHFSDFVLQGGDADRLIKIGIGPGLEHLGPQTGITKSGHHDDRTVRSQRVQASDVFRSACRHPQ